MIVLMSSFEFSLEQLILDSAEAVRPAKRMSVSQAAEEYRKLNNPGAYVGDWMNSTTPYLVEPMDVLQSQKFTGMAFAGPAQTGKALALDTPLATTSGWTTMGDVRVGDELFSHLGQKCRVVGATGVMYDHKCYRLKFANGEEVVADAEHIWSARPRREGVRADFRNITTQQMVEAKTDWVVRSTEPLSTPDADLPVDPYVLGAWLGDGHKYGLRIYAAVDDADDLRRNLDMPTRYHVDKKGLGVIALLADTYEGDTRKGAGRGERSTLRTAMDSIELGSGQDKHIPPAYLRASQEQRMALLQGLLDTDGHASTRGRVEFCSSYEKLASGFDELVRSLGYQPKRRVRGKSYQFTFSPLGGETLFRMARKQARMSTKKTRPIRQRHISVSSIEPTKSVPVRCIKVDSPESLYLFGKTMLSTHNTDMVLNWIAYSTKCDPADMMIVQTSQTTSRDFSIRRIDRLHRHSPKIGATLAPGTQSDNTFDKQYRSGMMLSMSWPAINELSGKPIPRLWLTDYDRMPENIDGEGDPFFLARKRATTFRSHGMCAAESSPGYMVTDPKWIRSTKHEAPPTKGILSIYNDGDRRLWHWQCTGCHDWFEPDFGLLKWPDVPDAMEAAENCYLECPHCEKRYSHDRNGATPGKHLLNQGGKWVPDNCTIDRQGVIHGTPIRSSIASFWLKGVAAAFADWKDLVFNFIVAERDYENTGSEEKLKTTTNTDQGHPYTSRAMASTRVPETLKSRVKPILLGTVAKGVRFLMATIDVQKNRFVVQIHGIHANRDISIVDRFDIRKSKRYDDEGERYWVNPGSHPEDWKLIVEEVMNKTYPLDDSSGRMMGVKQTLCDSAGKDGTTSNAYDFYRWLRYGDRTDDEGDETTVDVDEGTYDWQPGLAGRFLLLKGASVKTAPRVALSYPDSQRKDRHAGARGEVPVLMMNTNLLKDKLNHMLDRVEPGNGVLFPDGLSDNFFIELTVEVNDPQKGWINPRNFRNESWDLLAYCIAGLLTRGMNVEHINWQDPPSWAEEWDMNDLVFDPEIDDKPFEAVAQPRRSLKDIASNLA